jgi:hypothetical protein
MAMAASFGSWRQGVPVETLPRVLATLVWFFFYGLVCFAFSYHCFSRYLLSFPVRAEPLTFFLPSGSSGLGCYIYTCNAQNLDGTFTF